MEMEACHLVALRYRFRFQCRTTLLLSLRKQTCVALSQTTENVLFSSAVESLHFFFLFVVMLLIKMTFSVFSLLHLLYFVVSASCVCFTHICVHNSCLEWHSGAFLWCVCATAILMLFIRLQKLSLFDSAHSFENHT